MYTKSNFLIYFTNKYKNSEHLVNTDLTECYDILTGDLKISISYSKNITFAKSKDENIIILLSGNIYQDIQLSNVSTEEYLLNKYILHNKDFVKYLNGSFCLFFIQKDTSEIYFATDRLNTRKIYKFEKDRKLIFSTDINSLPLKDCKLSYAGISSYLINGIMLNNLTIFEEVIKLERASLNKIGAFDVISNQYWNYNFTDEYKNRSLSELTDELHELYLKSLNKIIHGKKNIFISLSGGYDSRGVAAMVKKNSANNTNITCFSHNFDNDIKDTDSDIARQIADKLGFNYKLLISYNKSPLQTFKINAELGHALASFCKESDAWEKINKDFEQYENSILLTGDMYDGTYVDFHGNIKRALEKARICEPSFLQEYKNYFSTESLKHLYESWDAEYNKILKNVSVHDNMVNLLDYLYMDQLIPNLYGIARECFQMPFIETATPYYDNDILDFIQKITPELRNRKELHKLTLAKYYPEIFSIKFSSRIWGKEPMWIDEIKSFSNDFIQNINDNESMLDNVIMPATIINSLISLKGINKDPYKKKTPLKSFHSTLKKILPSYHKLVEILPGGKEITRKAGKYIHPRISDPLIKILILRMYLIRN